MEDSEMVALARATDDEDPRTALAATARLRRAADQMESLVVRRARVSGMSWAEIAAYLGVTLPAAERTPGEAAVRSAALPAGPGCGSARPAVRTG